MIYKIKNTVNFSEIYYNREISKLKSILYSNSINKEIDYYWRIKESRVLTELQKKHIILYINRIKSNYYLELQKGIRYVWQKEKYRTNEAYRITLNYISKLPDSSKKFLLLKKLYLSLLKERKRIRKNCFMLSDGTCDIIAMYLYDILFGNGEYLSDEQRYFALNKVLLNNNELE